EVTDLVLEYRGSLSGEHGDGLARSEWNEKMFGPRLYRAFRRVKAAFDPHGLLNPGKIVAAPPMTDNLRYPPGYDPVEPPTVFDLCLMCKACKAECPSNVDVAKLKAEFLQFYYEGRPRPLGHLLSAHIHRFNRLAAPLAPLVNWLQTREISRRLLESFAGIDQR